MDDFNKITIPIFETDLEGAIRPNFVFHRSWDKLHSRCIEYPYAAAQIGNSKKILDVGTVNSDLIWIKWLESLPIEVHAVDYDRPKIDFVNIKFHKADIRDIPLESNMFDKVFAISVIEHIGMMEPQIVSEDNPEYDENGDLKAFEELIRVLKPGGVLVMTVPFGNSGEALEDQTARIYTKDTIQRFNKIAFNQSMDYYEYQYSKYKNRYIEYMKKRSIWQRFQDLLRGKKDEVLYPIPESSYPEHFGLVTWRRLSIESSSATHYGHADGIACGIWVKN